MKKIFFSFLSFCFLQIQAQTGIFQWEDHLNYQNGVDLIEKDQKIIAASRDALVYYNKETEQVSKFSTLDGLSETGISALNYHQGLKIIIITYESGNIDLIKDSKVVNIPAIVQAKNIAGSRTINHIQIYQDYAFLSCDFGIVKLNLKKQEIADTYLIGPNSTPEKINYSAIFQDTLFVGNQFTLWKAPINHPNINYYKTWDTVPLPSTIFSDSLPISHMIAMDEYLIFNVRNLKKYNNNRQYNYKEGIVDSFANHIDFEVRGMKRAANNQVAMSIGFHGMYYDSKLENRELFFDDGNLLVSNVLKDKDGIGWAMDSRKGLIRKKDFQTDFFSPTGPNAFAVNNMEFIDETMYISHGGRLPNSSPKYSRDLASTLKNNRWTNLSPDHFNISDVMSTVPDPNDESIHWVASFSNGLVRLKNLEKDTIFNYSNSPMDEHLLIPKYNAIVDVDFDKDKTLWIANQGAFHPVVSLSPDGKWTEYTFGSSIGATNDILAIETMRESNQKWIIANGTGIVVLDEKQEGKNYRVINSSAGNGKLISSEINCVTEDRNGQVWIGTKAGLSVITNPNRIFRNQNFDAKDILVFFDGNYEILLKGQNIYDIAVDGGNRKWFATAQGVFLTSPDGKTQLKHFTEDNSPLFSNAVLQVEVDQKSGNVFFATDKGIISYRDEAQWVEETKREVLVFPNPVLPEYQGPITIDGLIDESDVRIADMAGRVVFEGKSQGNRFVWHGMTHDGRKASPGVYLVYSIETENGDLTEVAKFAIVR
ncbi:MAG: hypothetical protein N4A45_12835 [Flavobacteriales bacterium]|jgi:streptogramin lyase|nr:hypothetical protein [Flavobacteriales bacterium]